jgi:ataxia telangiectasia mutated family protein
MHDVIRSLGSDKVKDRQEGLAAIREVFSQDRAVENFAIENGTVRHENFMLVFQALFRVVGKEKDLATRSTTVKSVSTTAALRRLADAANTLRWLIDRTVSYMNGKVATICTKHLVKFLQESEKIFDTVALDYSKALRSILAYNPHLDYLNEDTWLNIVSLSFNIILGDPIQKRLLGEDEMEVANEIDSDMYAEDTAEEESDQNPATSKGKKRSRRDNTPMPILSPHKSQKMARKKRHVVVSVSLEQVEFTSVLRLLLSAPNAPLLPAESVQEVEGERETDRDVGWAVLQRLQRFLEMYSADSSLLRDYIAILSSVLEHLLYNKVVAVQAFARATWDSLISLWSTKDKTMKEGLLIVFKQLFPFVTCPPISEQKLPSLDLAEGIGRLWHLLDSEAENRWGVDGLSLDALRLEIFRDEANPRNLEGGFVAKTFQAGWNFDAGQALSWAILQLQADCAATVRFAHSRYFNHSSWPFYSCSTFRNRCIPLDWSPSARKRRTRSSLYSMPFK